MKQIPLILPVLVLFSGCERPKPDGSCGIQGICQLPAGEDSNEPQRWVGLQITVMEINSPNADYKTSARFNVDEKGGFQIALNPGEYSIGVYDPQRLKNKITSPLHVKVSAGHFTDVVIDYDKLKVRVLPKQK
jgi:hypothetical protein